METSGIATAYSEVVAAQATLNATIDAGVQPESTIYQQASSRYDAAITYLFSCRPKSLAEIKFLMLGLISIEYEDHCVRKAVTHTVESGLLG